MATYKVKYTKAIGTEGVIIVRAENEAQALKNAKYLCFTGSDFKGAEKVNDSEYTKPRQQGYQGSERQKI